MLGQEPTFLEAVSSSYGTRSFQEGERLPLFRWDAARYTTFYVPGCLVVVEPDGAGLFEALVSSEVPDGARGPFTDWAAELQRHAQAAVDKAAALQHEPFRPECLTLYMNNECNLACRYCHTDPISSPAERLDLASVAAAGEVVARSCRDKGLPFSMVFHGGGEPTLHRDRVDRALDLLEGIAEKHGLEPFRYVATNGLLSEDKARWVARRFDLVGLSCDGPAEIHNRQRPRLDGGPSLEIVERTGRILAEEGCNFHVRTTITPESMAHQVAIAKYICDTYTPLEIHFEPVYIWGRSTETGGFRPDQAEGFANHFLQARAMAFDQGIPLSSSGSRLGTIHGPYCHVYRNTVNLVPGGVATACFKLTEGDQVRRLGADIGEMDYVAGTFSLNRGRVRTLQQELDQSYLECAVCFNRYHCARGCPDYCPLDGNSPGEPGFRCRVQKAMAGGILRVTAEHLWSEVEKYGLEGPHGTWLA
jgi:sulfatase maturation enzyme AslB (radical SAM superfamily)